MKKLMTMISAVAVAFGLQAAESVAPNDSGFKSGSDFEENGVGYAVTDSAYWAIPDGSASVVDGTHQKQDTARPSAFIDAGDSKVLKISSSLGTAGDEVVLNVNANRVVQDIGNGLYFDGLVKMSVFDADDTPIVPEDAKFAVYLKAENEEAADTDAAPLVVETRTGTFVTATRLKATDWHRLTIKMIANVYAQGTDVVPGFVVFVDGTRISCTSAKIADDSALTATAQYYNEGGTLFLSKVAIDSVSSIAFDGQGELGEVAFTTAAPSFAEDPNIVSYVVTWDAGVTGFMFNGKKVDGLTDAGSRTFTVEGGGQKPTITDITYAAGKMAKALDIGDAEATITSQDCAATVTIDGKATSYPSIEAAITDINKATSDVKLTLGAPAAGITLANANANVTITIDLAGQTITQGAEDTAAIYVESGSVVVDDTVGGGTVQGLEDANLVALVVSEGSATLNKGIYNGVVGGEGLAITSADVKILASANPDGVSATVPEGMELKEGPDGYLSLVEVSEDGTAEHPYTISTVADLQKLNTYKTGSKFFELKNDITLTEKWAGIGTYDNNQNADAFDGTFDGKGFAIRGVTFADNGEGKNNYRGFFNQVNNATIKNLTIEGDGFGTEVPSGEYGCALVVGCANNSTIENCVAKGTIASATHNLAGIAVRIKDTTIRNCRNEANLTGSYTKVAGIVALNQNSTSACRIEGCVNKGALTAAGNADKAGKDGLGGIVAYVGDDKLTITACTNESALVKGEGAHASAKVGQVIGWALNAAVVSDAIAVRNDFCTVGDGVVDGLNFATVAEDGKVTLVANSAAVAGASLKVMAAGQTVTLGAIGESITLDTTLAPVTVTTSAENATVTQEGNVYTVVEKKGITAWTDVTDETPLTDVPGISAGDAAKLEASNVKPSAIVTWANDAAKGNVTVGDTINLDAFVMDAANAATPAELAAKAAAEITQEVLDAIVAAGTEADLSAIAKKYPNATVTVVPATELVSTDTAKFFKLKFELKVAQ